MECPICNCKEGKIFTIKTQERKKREAGAIRCKVCQTIYLKDYMADRNSIYNDSDYSPWGRSKEPFKEIIANSKREAFGEQLSFLLKYVSVEKNKKLLDIGTANGYFLEVASNLGFDVYGIEPGKYFYEEALKRFPERIFCGKLEDSNYKDEEFDIITMIDVIEHISLIHPFFKEVGRILKKNGIIFIQTPNSNSWTRLLLGKNWFQYKYEHVIYFNKKSLKYLLERSGFQLLKARNNIKRFQLGYYCHYFKQYSFMGIEKLLNPIFSFLPSSIKTMPFSNPITGEMLVIAQKK